MNELQTAIAHLKEAGATPQEIEVYTRDFMSAHAAPADASSALQRERPGASGDWEAIPDGFKTAAGVGLSLLPMERPVALAARGIARVVPAVGAGVSELPVLRNVIRAARASQRAWQAGKAVQKVEREAPKALSDILGDMEILPGPPAAQTLEEAIANPNIVRATERYRTPNGALQKGAPKARFEYFAEQMAKRKAAQSAGAAEPTLEELLGLSLEHVKKGGSLKSASDALRIVRPR